MLGLDDYASSDEEDVNIPQNDKTSATSKVTPDKPIAAPNVVSEAQPVPTKPNEALQPAAAPPAAALEPVEEPISEPAPGLTLPSAAEDAPAVGPAAGPAAGPAPGPLTASASEPEDDVTTTPLSPYSANRAVVRNLTMPRVPNFEIPPSPPGSPPPKSTAQFSGFLKLKKQGVHFNDRLLKSSALRNPSYLTTLKEFAGISEEGQYATTLPTEVALPTSFPPWAYAEELGKSQQEIIRKREEEQRKTQREAVEFVSEGGSRSAGGISMAERVRAGLSRESSGSPSVSDGKSRSSDQRGEKRKSRFDETERPSQRR